MFCENSVMRFAAAQWLSYNQHTRYHQTCTI